MSLGIDGYCIPQSCPSSIPWSLPCSSLMRSPPCSEAEISDAMLKALALGESGLLASMSRHTHRSQPPLAALVSACALSPQKLLASAPISKKRLDLYGELVPATLSEDTDAERKSRPSSSHCQPSRPAPRAREWEHVIGLQVHQKARVSGPGWRDRVYARCPPSPSLVPTDALSHPTSNKLLCNAVSLANTPPGLTVTSAWPRHMQENNTLDMRTEIKSSLLRVFGRKHSLEGGGGEEPREREQISCSDSP
ncbi:hypothetical protein Bbelb_172830 [Branchiostoma belcheri]|nr:hypothetical protein Bbelb_172830 [Branchiostoma belcheri]